jgi:hypothetical protein
MSIGTEHDNEASLDAIKKSFRAVARKSERYQYDFEHGQWWVTELGTGRQWSVVDTSNGFDFEIVSVGDR